MYRFLEYFMRVSLVELGSDERSAQIAVHSCEIRSRWFCSNVHGSCVQRVSSVPALPILLSAPTDSQAYCVSRSLLVVRTVHGSPRNEMDVFPMLPSITNDRGKIEGTFMSSRGEPWIILITRRDRKAE